MVKHYEVHVIFQNIEYQLRENILHNLHLIEKYLLSTENYLLETFATLPVHINYLHPSIKNTTILYFYRNLSCICY